MDPLYGISGNYELAPAERLEQPELLPDSDIPLPIADVSALETAPAVSRVIDEGEERREAAEKELPTAKLEPDVSAHFLEDPQQMPRPAVQASGALTSRQVIETAEAPSSARQAPLPRPPIRPVVDVTRPLRAQKNSEEPGSEEQPERTNEAAKVQPDTTHTATPDKPPDKEGPEVVPEAQKDVSTKPEQLALPPGQERLYYGDVEFIGHRYHYDTSQGKQVGLETMHTSGGRITNGYTANDLSGNTIDYPAQIGGFTIEGPDISGVQYHTVARDRLHRPAKVIGAREYNLSPAAEASLMQELREQPVPQDEVGAFDSVDEMLAVMYRDSDTPELEEREEVDFHYDETTGLLAEVVRTSHWGGSVEKVSHRNFFDAAGQRTAYLQRKLVDIDPSTHEEIYDPTELRLYDHRDGLWREFQYIAYGQGLIPFSMHEGRSGILYTTPDTIVQRPVLSEDLLAYDIAANPVLTTLIELTKDLQGIGTRTVSLPAWIPKDAALAIAQEQTSIWEASTIPLFSETENVHVSTPQVAIAEASEAGMHEIDASSFINELAAKQRVVLHPAFGKTTSMMQITVMARLQQVFSDVQKVTVALAMHEVFGQDELKLEAMKGPNRQYFGMLLRALDLPRDEFIRVVNGIDNLSDKARHIITYLTSDV